MDVSADEKQRIREKIEKLKQSKFKQQTLPAWRPVPTAMSTMMTFSIFSVVFLAIGIVLYVMSDQIVEFEKRYDKECATYKGKNNQAGLSANDPQLRTCWMDFQEIKEPIPGPIYVYYQLDNFYQNHRRYVKSRDNQQLNGQYKEASDLESACDPIVRVKDLWENQRINLNKDKMQDNYPAIPCGLVAKSFFNDTFELHLENSDGTTTPQDIQITSIAWSSDLEFKFKNIENVPEHPDTNAPRKYQDIQWMDMTNEHFIVWMRTAGLPNFRKLWGTITKGLPKGKFKLKIEDNYEVAPFNGAKSFVLSTTNALGGKNYFLAICYIVVGTLCLLFSFVFCFAYMKKKTNNS